MFSLVDVILIVIVLVFALTGFAWGLIQGIGALVGLAAGIFAATNYYFILAGWLTPIFLGNAVLAKIVAFIAIFAIANRLVGLVFWIINKTFNIIAIIPFIKPINRIAGLILGLAEGIIITGVSLYVIAKFGGNIPWLAETLNNSQVAHWLVSATQFLNSFLP
ncbi:MAG: CvpA family protein [Patescibacteria group bacterium]